MPGPEQNRKGTTRHGAGNGAIRCDTCDTQLMFRDGELRCDPCTGRNPCPNCHEWSFEATSADVVRCLECGEEWRLAPPADTPHPGLVRSGVDDWPQPAPLAGGQVVGGHGLAELVQVESGEAGGTEAQDSPRPRFRVASAITRRHIEWAWCQRFPYAEPSALAGDGGAGKSTLAQELVARTTRGQLGSLPGGGNGEPRGAVIISVEEDDEAVIMPRLAAMGADLERVLILWDDPESDKPALTLPSGHGEVAYAAKWMDAGIVVVDTGPGLLDPDLRANREEDVRRYFRPLARIAREHRALSITLCHLNKGAGGDARHRVTGSAAWVNVPRAVLMMGAPPGDDLSETPERIVAVAKANLVSGRVPPAVAVRLTPGRDDATVGTITWEGEREGIRAQDLTAGVSDEDRSERGAVIEAIQDLLVDGPRPAKDCEAELKRAGHAARTIRRAREAMGITRSAGTVAQDGFRGQWVWTMPTTDDQ